MGFSYVNILHSLGAPTCYYTGLTDDLKARIAKHNEGGVPHTSKHRPWRIKTAIAFTSRQRAAEFERYLKTGSGRVFAAKHL